VIAILYFQHGKTPNSRRKKAFEGLSALKPAPRIHQPPAVSGRFSAVPGQKATEFFVLKASFERLWLILVDALCP
jgi:hypothetical protein